MNTKLHIGAYVSTGLKYCLLTRRNIALIPVLDEFRYREGKEHATCLTALLFEISLSITVVLTSLNSLKGNPLETGLNGIKTSGFLAYRPPSLRFRATIDQLIWVPVQVLCSSTVGSTSLNLTTATVLTGSFGNWFKWDIDYCFLAYIHPRGVVSCSSRPANFSFCGSLKF